MSPVSFGFFHSKLNEEEEVKKGNVRSNQEKKGVEPDEATLGKISPFFFIVT
jgi:hypothetical protein